MINCHGLKQIFISLIENKVCGEIGLGVGRLVVGCVLTFYKKYSCQCPFTNTLLSPYPFFRLTCTCAAAAKAAKSTGFALTRWGQCFSIDKKKIRALKKDGSKSIDTCFRGDGSHTKCIDGKDGDREKMLCVGDENAAYLYRIEPSGFLLFLSSI